MLRIIRPEDKDQVVQFAAKLFAEHEPMTRATGKSVSDMVELFGPITAACCCSGMSFMLEQQETGTNTILSLSLALPYASYNAVQWPDVPRPAQVILKTLPNLLAEQEAVSVYMFLWGTHSNHMGKGFIKTVVEASLQAARQVGFSSVVVDVTNVVSQHLAMSHFGFQPLEPKARYHDHETFKVVECSEYIIRAMKDLTAEQSAVPAEPSPEAQEDSSNG